MSDYSVTPYMPDDILFERHAPEGTEHIWLSESLSQMVNFCNKQLCEANAKEVYEVATILELKASELRDQFNVSRRLNFRKDDK